MNMKKLMALLLSLMLVIGLLPTGALAEGADYELRVLTFEDADYKGGTNFAGGSNWSSLIDNPQYGGSMLYPDGSGTTDESKAYTWYDAGNTELKHMLPKSWDNYCYWGGGHAVSNYVSSDFEAHGTYNDQLTVYSKNASTGIDTTGGGHNGSDNFAVHFGYKDNSGYTDSQILPSFAFADGSEHVIDHMYVNNICYALNCYLNGNGLTAKIGDDDWVKMTATGYDAKGTKTGDASIYLCNGPKNIIMDWTKFDLSGLGKVQKVEFNITGSSDNGYGFSQPAYFAYDDVAVRFEKAAPAVEPWDGTTQTEPALADGVYQIGTAEELAWFGAQTRKTGKAGISGILTNDIDLGGHDWASCMIGATSSYGTGFSGTFDGAGHTIKGFALTKSIKGNSNSTYGFVGFAENADIKNFTLEGTIVLDFSACTETARVFHSGVIAYSKGCTISGITSNVASRIENDANGYATGYMGGILGVAGSSTASGSETYTLIENCVNNGTLSTGTEAGGIVCRAFKGTVVRNCLNTGAITAVGITSGNAGGIAGQIAGSTIEGCANYGAITGTSDVGGIAGFMEGTRSNSVNWASTVQNCYNTGACYSTALGKSGNGVGGVIGSANGYTSQKLYSELKNCYSTGAVGFDASSAYASKSYAGGVTGDAFYVNGSNVYYLDTVAAKANGENSTLRVNFTDVTAKTADELKSDDVLTLLGSGFKKDLGKVNGGYPVLSWQTSEGTDVPDVPVQPEAKPYTVAVGDGSSIAMGETANVTLTVGNDKETTYNAYHFEVTYDAEKLTYTGINTDAAVKDENGKLTVNGYGADKTCGTDNIVLSFTGKAMGEATVTVTAANIDKAANAAAQDAPAATIGTAAAVITVGGYTVDLSDDFTGESTVAPGADYTFTAKDPHYDYVFTGSSMGGGNVEVIDNGDGTFTVKNVSGNLIIRDTKTPKKYPVTWTGSAKSHIFVSDYATYGKDFDIQFNNLNTSEYDYTLTVTVNGMAYTPELTLDSDDARIYNVKGADVVGPIVITAEQTRKAPTTTAITFTGSGSGDVVGGTSQTATNGVDFPFTLNADAGFDYTVKLGDEELTADAEGKYTIPAAKLTGEALTVTVEKTAKQILTVEVAEYLKLNGRTMWLVTAAGTVSEGKILSYDGTPMMWSDKYEVYSYLVISDKTLEEVKTEATGKIAEATAEKVRVSYDCDVNKTGSVDINDVQLVYNMYNAKYDSFDRVPVLKFLEADVNGDKTVSTLDATAIINRILG